MIQVVKTRENGKFGIVWNRIFGELRNLGIIEVPDDAPLGEHPDDAFDTDEYKIERSKEGWF